ncbi:DUF6894 family protein [Bradyrhizobium sp. 2TAF24]|uniref:DUF6894 family protein n=1 Tax=Bradyrhizobium sp. 2TAF24 TaxID=3233011 RepID=UPI003F9323E8
MVQVYFHCSNALGLLVDRQGTSVDDLSDARAQAVGLVRSMVGQPSAEDWREWLLHASDEDGDEIFVLPFVAVLGKAH